MAQAFPSAWRGSKSRAPVLCFTIAATSLHCQGSFTVCPGFLCMGAQATQGLSVSCSVSASSRLYTVTPLIVGTEGQWRALSLSHSLAHGSSSLWSFRGLVPHHEMSHALCLRDSLSTLCLFSLFLIDALNAGPGEEVGQCRLDSRGPWDSKLSGQSPVDL